MPEPTSIFAPLSSGVFTTLAQAAALPRPPFRPFIDPLELHQWWWLLLIPMAFGVAVVYKAVRVKTMDKYWQQVAIMTVQIVLGMVALAAASYWLVMHFAQFIAERAV